MRQETGYVAEQFVAASLRQCNCSQHPDHPAVPIREEHRRTGRTSILTLTCSVLHFSFPQAQSDHREDPF